MILIDRLLHNVSRLLMIVQSVWKLTVTGATLHHISPSSLPPRKVLLQSLVSWLTSTATAIIITTTTILVVAILAFLTEAVVVVELSCLHLHLLPHRTNNLNCSHLHINLLPNPNNHSKHRERVHRLLLQWLHWLVGVAPVVEWDQEEACLRHHLKKLLGVFWALLLLVVVVVFSRWLGARPVEWTSWARLWVSRDADFR